MLALAFADRGYQVLEASNGYTGLRVAQVERPAAIVLDLALPEMSGLEVLDELKGAPATARIPVVAISGVAEWLREAGCRGAAATIAKPFELYQVVDQVQKLASPLSLSAR